MRGASYIIAEAASPDEEVTDVATRLLAQLTPAGRTLTAEHLGAVISWPGSHLFFAREGATGEISGMLVLGFYRAVSGNRAWVEDVVVDHSHRGRGLGRMLVDHAAEYARHLGANTLMLTSNPTREAANLLYRNAGFRLKETNLYYMNIDK